MKRLNMFSLGIGAGIGLPLGVALPILFIWWFIYSLHKSVELSKTGTSVMATVSHIKTIEARRFYDSENPVSGKEAPVKTYHIVARWQNPQTGKTHTLRSPVKDADQFPVGSSVPFLIDPRHPRWHILDTRNA